MKIPRRTFLRTAPAALAAASLPAALLAAPAAKTRISDDRFDPWVASRMARQGLVVAP